MNTNCVQFSNHPPLNIKNAMVIASASTDGGCYDGIGFDVYQVYRGKNLHLIHQYNSGWGGEKTQTTHLGVFKTKEELIRWLLTEREEGCVPWWVNELLSGLGYEGEEA